MKVERGPLGVVKAAEWMHVRIERACSKSMRNEAEVEQDEDSKL
jgi:hypothetical protein